MKEGNLSFYRPILGLLKTLQGEVLVKGQHPKIRTDFVGYVPQNSKWNHHFSVKVGDVLALGIEESGRWGWGSQRKLEKDHNRY